MQKTNSRIRLDPDAPIYICAVSATLVGVCLTTIGLIRVIVAMSKVETFADNILAIDAVIFLISTLTSYWSLRTRSVRRLHLLERVADVSFITAICIMALACVFMALVMGVR